MHCIYCLQDKSKLDFRKREHVIPQCFGRFSPDNLILRYLVCDECNQFFGDKIELFWGRDSLEGLLRLKHGLKPKDTLKKKKRLKSKIHEGFFKGVIVTGGVSESGKGGVEKLVQAGFYNKKNNEYDYFEIGNIPSATELLEQGYDIKERIIRLIGDSEEVKLLENELKEKGISLKGESELIKESDHGQMVTVESEAILDRVIIRGICKIAFNYLAYLAGERFVLSKDFDGIRYFIRNDTGNCEKYLSVNQPPILYDDRELEKHGIKVTEGHLIILGWENDRKLFSRLSLFNTHTYGINLSDNYNGLWIPIQSGHYFDIVTKEVSKLLFASNQLIP